MAEEIAEHELADLDLLRRLGHHRGDQERIVGERLAVDLTAGTLVDDVIRARDELEAEPFRFLRNFSVTRELQVPDLQAEFELRHLQLPQGVARQRGG